MVAPLRVPTSLGRRWPHHSDPPVVVNVSWMSVEYLPVPVNVSDKLRLCELELGPVEIVDDYPLIAWRFSHQFFVCLPEGSWIYLSNHNLHLQLHLHDFGLLAHDHQLCNVSRRYLWLIEGVFHLLFERAPSPRVGHGNMENQNLDLPIHLFQNLIGTSYVLAKLGWYLIVGQ